MNTQFDKNTLHQTGLSYDPIKDQTFIKTSRTVSNLDKQNVIPCGAQIQSFVTTLNQKKHFLKNLLVEKQKYTDITHQQTTKLSNQSIKQTFEVQRQMQLHQQNMNTLEQVQNMKKQKLKSLQKLLTLKKSLEQRFQQMVQMKKLLSDLKEQNTTMEVQIQQMNRQNQAIQDQTSDLDLMSQNLDNELFHMRQTVRQTASNFTTTQSALNMMKSKIQQTLTSTKLQNKETRHLSTIMQQVTDKIKKLREQKAQYDINSNQLMIRNHHIQDTNTKLRNDLEKCKNHLMCVLKNNQILNNSIEQFTFIDEKVGKMMRKNQLKKL